MNSEELKHIIEAVLFASDEPLNINRLMSLFPEDSNPGRDAIKQVVAAIQEDYKDRSLELKEVSSGYRFQVKQDFAQWSAKLWEERPARYSRATLETLALIAYRQPITRGEIEEVRGVSVSTQIMKSLLERDWIKVVGHRDVPGKPALYATTREFLDYFNLKSLEELPTLAELRDIDAINAELELTMPTEQNQPAADTVENNPELSVQADAGQAEADTSSGSEHIQDPNSPVAAMENDAVIEKALTAEN
jgi:segregation and condensation protein B